MAGAIRLIKGQKVIILIGFLILLICLIKSGRDDPKKPDDK
jgi:hypothetical protein